MSQQLNVHAGDDPRVKIKTDMSTPITIDFVVNGRRHYTDTTTTIAFVGRMDSLGWREFASSAARVSEEAFAKANELEAAEALAQALTEEDES